MHLKYLVVAVFLMLCLWWARWRERRGSTEQPVESAKPKQRRRLRPRTPQDCGQCRVEGEQEAEEAQERQVRAWSEVKSSRGRKKTKDTEGYACPNQGCAYYGITEAKVHALLDCGSHGKKEQIQDLYCQACGRKFTERRNTPLYRLKTAAQRVAEVLAALAEGLDVGAGERMFGHSEAAIQRWLTGAGMHAQGMHEQMFHDLKLWHVQLDELKTRLREKTQELWLWVALEVQSKVIPIVELGPRTQALAHQLIHNLKQVLADNCLPVFTSDGLRMYFYALITHWGAWNK